MSYRRALGLSPPLITGLAPSIVRAGPIVAPTPGTVTGAPPVAAPPATRESAIVTALVPVASPGVVDAQGCRYVPRGGLPSDVPAGTIVVYAWPVTWPSMMDAGLSRTEVATVGQAAAILGELDDYRRSDPRFSGMVNDAWWGWLPEDLGLSVQETAPQNRALFYAVRTSRPLGSNAAELSQVVNSGLQAIARRYGVSTTISGIAQADGTAAGSWPHGPPRYTPGGTTRMRADVIGVRSRPDLIAGALNAVGSLNDFAVAFSIPFNAAFVSLAATAAQPAIQEKLTLEAAVHVDPSLAAAAVEQVRAIVTTANSQMAATPDAAEISNIGGAAHDAIGAVREQVRVALALLQRAVDTRIPSSADVASGIARMRAAAVRKAEEGRGRLVGDVGPALRAYYDCTLTAMATQTVAPLVQQTNEAYAWLLSNGAAAQASAAAAIAALHQAMQQIDVLEGQLNLPWYKSRFLGLAGWAWVAIGATAFVGTVAAVRVVKSRRKAATAVAKNSRRRTSRRRAA